ncbi:hypothetical protein NQ117_06305 [Paenibacillus sp. SC116]|uniref:hypothetical protein n=1 Tax=Paenibacillus sp. SC116 TaxID=2968986 RepID=UPI00215B47F9|nr:hypothetical protein [Paenibacillus sp. SC116]MCR8843289.1 hypothetical protein [Paenibacillus sp. SC116]
MKHTVDLKSFYVAGTFHECYEDMYHHVVEQSSVQGTSFNKQKVMPMVYGLRLEQRYFSGVRCHSNQDISDGDYVIEVRGGSYEMRTYNQLCLEAVSNLSDAAYIELPKPITIIEFVATPDGYTPWWCYIPVSFKPWEDMRNDRRLPRHLKADMVLRESRRCYTLAY